MRFTPELSDRDVGREYRRFLQWTGEKPWIEKIKKLKKLPKLSGLDLYPQYLAEKNALLPPIRKYLALETTGKSVRRHVSQDIVEAAGYLMVINKIAQSVDDSVQKRLKGAILDDDGVKAFLFELQIAIHFLLRGHDVQFMDLENKAHYDLLVSDGSQELEVECKRKSVDAGRKIKRPDFYLLAEILFARLSRIKKRFVVMVELEGAMGADTSLFRELAKSIEKCIGAGRTEDQIKHIQFKIEMLPSNLRIRSDPEAAEALAPYYSGSAHYSIFSGKDTTLLVKCESTVRDRVLKAIYDELKAGARQLSGTRPGLLACFLEDIDDAAWDQLTENSGLHEMTATLSSSDNRRHVNLVVYSSDRSQPTRQGNVLSFPTAHVRYWNPKAKFDLNSSFLGFS